MKKSNLIYGLAFAAITTFGLTPSFAQDMQGQEPTQDPTQTEQGATQDQTQPEQQDQTQPGYDATQSQTQNDQVSEVSADELPGAVSRAWEDNKADGDQVSRVYKITSADGTERYRVEYIDGSSQSQYVEYDGDGNEL